MSYLILGGVAGLIAGLLGVGGGILIVPALTWLFTAAQMPADRIVHMAVATSLATIVFTSVSSVYAHHRRGGVRWGTFAALAPGIVFGALGGGLLAHHLSDQWLGRLFGIAALLVALKMGFQAQPVPRSAPPSRLGLGAAGTAIGGLSALIGIGGGTLTVPYLVWRNIDPRQAVATSSATGLPIAIAGTSGFVVAGWGHPSLPDPSLGYVYLPALIGIAVTSVVFAPLGARIAHRLPATVLKRVFAVFLAGVGLLMLTR